MSALQKNERVLLCRRRALVAEPTEQFQKLLCTALAERKIGATAVADGRAALEWLVVSPTPDLIVLADALPIISGDKLLAQIRAIPRLAGVPVVLLASTDDVAFGKNVVTLRRPVRRSTLFDVVDGLFEDTVPTLPVSPVSGPQAVHFLLFSERHERHERHEREGDGDAG